MFCFFFFKQKTAYEMRISDWSSDVCSSDLALEKTSAILSDISGAAGMVMVPNREQRLAQFSLVDLGHGRALAVLVGEDGGIENRVIELGARSEERRVGKE